MNNAITSQANNQIITTIVNKRSKKRLLIIDDEPDITLTFKISLESTGLFEVYTFDEPLKALANFKAHFYDLVLTDIKMPKMTGYEFSQKIRETDNDAKVCFLTATEDYHCDNGNWEQKEAECFIKKPVGIGELVKQINSILEWPPTREEQM